MMDRLLREGNPPAGQLASPKPQYKDVQTNNWEELKGEGGASYVKDKDVFAKLEQARALLDAISGKDFATQTTLAAVLAKLADFESELATIKANQLSGDQKVQLSGTIPEPSINADTTLSIEPGQSYTLYEGSSEEGGRFAGLVVVARNPTNNANDLLIDIRFARVSTQLDNDYYALWHERLTTANGGISTVSGTSQGVAGTQIKSRFVPLLRAPFKISVSVAPGGSTATLLGLRAYFYNQRV